jgi:acyl carrier protein
MTTRGYTALKIMDRAALYLDIEQLLQLPAGTISGDQLLKKVPRWDSFAVVSFIVMAQNAYGVALKPDRIMACETFDSLAIAIEEQRKPG